MMARKRSKVLSERQKKILEVLEQFQLQTGYPPSIREICEQADISSTSVVNYYLEQLEELGFIERDGRVSRGIRLLKPLSEVAIAGQPASGGMLAAAANSISQSMQNMRQTVEELLHVPVLGSIVAGEPVPVFPSNPETYNDPDTMISVATSLLPSRERASGNLFALEVKGDSMIDAMVNDGDIVIMKPAREARNGEMVAVWLTDRDETTLKYFYMENGRVRLQPANPTMGPIYIEDPSTVEVQGKVVMVIRQIGGLAS
jgi:repressor LexA